MPTRVLKFWGSTASACLPRSSELEEAARLAMLSLSLVHGTALAHAPLPSTDSLSERDLSQPMLCAAQ